MSIAVTAARSGRWSLLLFLNLAGCSHAPPQTALSPVPPHSVRGVAPAVPNDNRTPAGSASAGAVSLRLDARLASWKPDLQVDTTVTVQAFAEEGGAPTIPGPLLRTSEGTEVRVSIRNSIPDSTLVVHGLRAGTVSDDSLHVPPGAVREVRFRAGAPGTYLYWGTTSGSTYTRRSGRDSQLTGAIVIDPAGTRPDPDERIFVMTLIDIFTDTVQPPPHEEIWEIAINGLSWPHTERLEYAVGDTVRWRWINGTDRIHPMHLHGFHFRTLARGDGRADTTYAENAVQVGVTELMRPAGTWRMEWVPTRQGAWLVHCHMTPHIAPYPARPDSVQAHDLHDLARHPLEAMAGLVLGIDVHGPPGAGHTDAAAATRLRLVARQAHAEDGKPTPHGYVLQRGDEPPPDSVEVPGPPLVLTRGETTAITVVNRLDEPTTVHWHGMELESVYDGVSGWSRTGASFAPMLASGDSFTVSFTPPRAGTFMYHTHMDEGDQLRSGMYGPLIVLEPGERFDPATDLVFMVGGAVDGERTPPAINGRHHPAPLTLRAGTRYRLRLANILRAAPVQVELLVDSLRLDWRPISKDGADLPELLRGEGPAVQWIGVGEIYDFEWTPRSPVDAVLQVRFGPGALVLRQPIHVRD